MAKQTTQPEFRQQDAAVVDTGAIDTDVPLHYGPPGLQGVFYNKYVTACALGSAMGGFLFGYDQGCISVILVMPTILEYMPEVGDGSFYKALLTALIELGAFIGALNTGWVADRYSRKRGISIAVVWFAIGSVLQTAAQDYAMLCVGRLIGGIGIGMLSTLAPLYMSEVSSPEIRGTLLVMEEFNIVLGIIIAYWFTFGTRYWETSQWSWRLPFLVQLFPGLALGFGVYYFPYSPRWLSLKQRHEESLESLSRLRQLPPSDPRVQREWMEIRAETTFQLERAMERHPSCFDPETKEPRTVRLDLATWADLFQKKIIRRTSVGVLIMFFQQFVGINALIYYSPSLFEQLGLDYDLRLIMSGILNVLQLFGVAPCLVLMDIIGRRRLLLWGSSVMFATMLIVAILVGLYTGKWDQNQDKAWAGVAMLFIYMLAFGFSLGPVGWAMPAEVFPTSVRAKGVAISTCSNWLNNFIVGLITPPMISHTGYGTFVFFAIFCLLSVVYTYFQIPETARLTLEEIDTAFNDTSGHEDEARKDQIMKELLAEAGMQVRRPSIENVAVEQGMPGGSSPSK